MSSPEQWRQYREVIDELVEECRHGQGQVLAGWVRRGVWLPYASEHPEEMPEEHRMNQLLGRLPQEDRQLVARMLEQAHEGAVHDTLRVLHEHEMPPFDDAYEGTPFHDFVGRLQGDWSWPD